MDVLALLQRAQEVGLRVEPIGGKLLVRGPKRAEAVVTLLVEHKAEVLYFEPIDCLIRFGKSWRGDARKALIAFGLGPPGFDGDQL
jgi:hypothetical protein